MHFLPHYPLHFNPIVLFGLTLLLGLLGGELARMTRILPRISGYIIVGFLVGPNGLNITTPSALADASYFVDIALGLILFDLGRHLDLKWLRHDRGLLPMAITESSLTFIFVFSILYFFDFPWLPSALAATIATATSPAIVMMVAHDISSDGPITRRTMMLTSLNNLFSLVLFTILLPITHIKSTTPLIIIEHISYRLLGSIILGFILFVLTISLSRLTGKNKESQFIFFVGAVTVGIGLAISLNLSTMLTLFTFGVAARNLDRAHELTEIDFGWLARLLFVILFVVTGIYLQFQGLWQATSIVLAFLLMKILAKMLGVFIFSGASRLTTKQSLALSFTLAPMAELAIGMSNRLVDFNPNFSHQLITIIAAAVAILYIVGPIAVQIAFIKTGEATAGSD
jgi:Kef-type K+ transport system membrane component KefB